MSTELLEAKLADISRRLEFLEARSTAAPSGKGWETIAGRAAQDDLLEEAMRLGAEWRARANAAPPAGAAA